MTHKQALEASKHNPTGVMKVLEGLEVECWHCEGVGYLEDEGRDYGSCPICFGKKKVKYHWSPQVGEWCIVWGKEVALVYKVYDDKVVVNIGTPEHLTKNITPIFEWEEVERVLEKAGYWLDISKPLDIYLGKDHMKVWCKVKKGSDDTCIVSATGSSRTRAVYEAVLALGKELKC